MPPKDPVAYDRKRHQERRARGLCVNCGMVSPAPNRVACENCRAKQESSKARLIRQRKAKGLCYRCGRRAPDSGFKICAPCSAQWRERYRVGQYKVRYRGVRQAWRNALKLEAFQAYGGPRCVCCSEAQMAFLTLDHIDGKGREHRDEVRARGNAFYAWARRAGFPQGFRVLCMNCNFALGHAGVCPHGTLTCG